MGDIFIHIGAPKTATSFIQKRVFKEITSANSVITQKIEIEGSYINLGDCFDFCPSFWKTLESDPFLKERKKGLNSDVLVSSEYIFGGISAPKPWIPGPVSKGGIVPRPRRHTHSRPDPYFVASHFKELKEASHSWGYDNIKIILTIRRQDTFLASFYAQASNRVRGAGQSNFENWIQYILNNTVGYNKGGGAKLDYYVWWKEIIEVLGRENVLFIPFELLKENAFAFLKQFLDFIEEYESTSIARSLANSSRKENVRSKTESRWNLRPPIREGPGLSRRVSSKLFEILQDVGFPKCDFPARIPLRWPDFHRDKEVRLSKKLSRQILETYKESNKNISKEIRNLDFKSFGYY